MVSDGQSGLLFRAGGPADLCKKVKVLTADRELCSKMGSVARQVNLQRFTAEKNYRILLGIYQMILE